MSYCKNCGTELPDGAHFCALCGTPSGDMPVMNGAQPYAGAPSQGAAGAPSGDMSMMNGAQPYAGAPSQGAAGAPSGDMSILNTVQPYGNMPPYGAAGVPYGNGQAMNMANTMPQYGNVPPQGVYPAANPYGSAAQPQSSRKALVIVGAIVGLILVIAVVLLVVLLTRDNSHGTYQQAVGVFMDGLKQQDMDKMCEAFPVRLQEEVRKDLLLFYGSEAEFWEDYNEDIEWYCGKNAKMTYEIEDAEPLLAYEIEDYEEDCLVDFRYNVSISAGYRVEVEMTFKGSEGEFDSELELDVVKIDGKWYVISY
ncbi:MAG: zinc-ribbon domain-containing protein [Clostridium sp.]|nr:zinc-ribbon domain-containing protein [Clostridium sp.]